MNHLEKVKEYYLKNDLVLRELKAGHLIYFKGEKQPMELKAIGNRFAVCVRKIHRWYDADLLHFEVERGAYYTFTEAYNALKDDLIYSCLDFENLRRAPHNLIFNAWDFRKQKDINDLLKQLESGKVELSQRHYSELNIDWGKTNFCGVDG